jgi:anti-sigma-K factor RskA
MNALYHIDELAELYALGTLEDAERERVDAHVQTCNRCAARVGEAEAVVAAMVPDVEPPHSLDDRVRAVLTPQRGERWLGPLLAAAFVLGLLPSAWFFQTLHTRSAFDEDRRNAIVAMLHSHFTHAQFSAITPDAPKAKVIFARGGSWCYIVAQTAKAYDVHAERAGRSIDLGTLRVSGDAAELFVPQTDAQALLLLDGSRPVARARLPDRATR